MSQARKIRRLKTKQIAKMVRKKDLPTPQTLQEAIGCLQVVQSQLDTLQTAVSQMIQERGFLEGQASRFYAIILRMFIELRKRNPSQFLVGGKAPNPVHEIMDEVRAYEGEYDAMQALAHLTQTVHSMEEEDE